MQKQFWKMVSIFMILALVFSATPAARVEAAAAQISGAIIVPDMGGSFKVNAYPVGGGYDNCWGEATWSGSSYTYILENCNSTRDYTLVTEGMGYTFKTVQVPAISFTPNASALDIYPVDREISGHVYMPNSEPWEGFTLNYGLNGTPLTVVTDANGFFSIPNVTDASYLEINPEKMGYRSESGNWNYQPPLQVNDKSISVRFRGDRYADGRIEQSGNSQVCRAGVTITAAREGAVTIKAVSDSDGNFNLAYLEPIEDYTVTASKAGCAYTQESLPLDVRFGNSNQGLVFQVVNTGIFGKVKPKGLGNSTMTEYASLAYYLIATYTTGGISYSNSVNWVDGGYWIQVPPNDGGTLTISRVGGPAAFGYELEGSSVTVPAMKDGWVEQNMELTPARVISGTIVGQNGVPVQKDATVDFGYWLHWQQPGTKATYSMNAQPKVYYLSPKENGILSATPTRYLVNLTAVPAVTTANFTMNLRTFSLDGCLNSQLDDSMVLPIGSVRFRPAAGYGTVVYPATLTADGCGPLSYGMNLKLPKGVAGTIEADNHTLSGNIFFDAINGDNNAWFKVSGDRAITGRVNVANRDIDLGWFGHMDMLSLRDAATNNRVNPNAGFEATWEFSYPMLERKAYTLSYNLGNIPDGYEVNRLNNIVPANLTSGDVDLPASFFLSHTPIDPNSATGKGYFIATGLTQDVTWGWPMRNNNDRINRFEMQVGPASTVFSETAPIVVSIDADDTNHTFSGLTVGTLYRWRVRAVFEYDKGPWMETAPQPTTPGNFDYLEGDAASPVTFEWNPVAFTPSNGTVKYVVQYSDNPAFPAAPASTTLLPTTVTSATTTTNPPVGKMYYWRVKAQLTVGTVTSDISGWSPTQVFFNRFKLITNAAHRPYSGNNPHAPIQFTGTDANVLPAGAYYQVQFGHDGNYDELNQDEGNTFTFTKPTSLSVYSSPRYLNGFEDGTSYNWRIRIVFGNDSKAKAMTNWVPGASFTLPW